MNIYFWNVEYYAVTVHASPHSDIHVISDLWDGISRDQRKRESQSDSTDRSDQRPSETNHMITSIDPRDQIKQIIVFLSELL